MVFIDGKLQLLAAWLVRNKIMNNSYQCPKFEKTEEMAARKSEWRWMKSPGGWREIAWTPPCWTGLSGWLLAHLSCCFSEWYFERRCLGEVLPGQSASWPPPPHTTCRCCLWVSERSPPVNSTPSVRRKLLGINFLSLSNQHWENLQMLDLLFCLVRK